MLETPNFLLGGSIRFKLLTIPLALTVALCVGMGWYVWDSYTSFKKVQIQDLRIQKLSGDIAYLDEVLTSSARLSATTGNKRWEERYLSYVPKLDAALAEAQKLLPTVFKSDAFTKTNAANEKLIALETQSFYLVNKSNQKAATALLLSPEYEDQKKIYSQGLVEVTSALQKYVNANIQAKSQQAFTAIALLLITLVVLLLAWTSLLLTILRYRRLTEFSSETIVVHQAGKIKYINSAGATLFGARKSEELIDKSIFNFLYSYRQETLEPQAQLRQEKKEAVMLVEDRLVRFDEQVIDVEIVETSIVYCDKPAKQVLIRDITKRKQTEAAMLRAKIAEGAKLQLEIEITDRKKVEAALRSSMETNRALLDAIPDLMFRISKNGILVNFKAAKENNLPIASSELLGKQLEEVWPQEISQPIINSVEIALETKKTQILEIQLPVNNKLLDYEIRIAISAKDEVMAIVRDITQSKQAEADIRRALEREKELGLLKSHFVTMTSHEFRTPLTAILSSSELLELYSHKWSEDKKLSHLKRIQGGVKQMIDLLNDVLLIGKAEAGKLEFNPISLDLVQFCRDLVEEMELTSINHKITFRTQAFCTNSQCVTACMDEKLLRHILSNLLSNAIKYSPQDSTIDFSFVCQQEATIFQIKDRGIGIPIVDQDKLFNSFHRASNVGTISGTGLGLAIVKKSVDSHGGKITVESEVGVGTTFIVTLPLNKTA